MQICPTNKTHDLLGQYTVCPRSIYTSYVVGYYIKWVTILLGHRVLTETHTGFGSLFSLVIQRIFPL